MSSFSYVFYKKEDNQVKCTYFGAFNGFKQQYLLPEFNIIKSSVYCKSSLSPQLMSWDRMLEFKKDLMYGEIQ